MTNKGRDRHGWIPRGNFDLKNAYSIAINSISSPPFTASWIWKSKTLLRMKTFLWRCAHDSIGVKVCLARRGVVDEELCPICQGESKLVLYALKDCAWVKVVWIQLELRPLTNHFGRLICRNDLILMGRLTQATLLESSHGKWSIHF